MDQVLFSLLKNIEIGDFALPSGYIFAWLIVLVSLAGSFYVFLGISLEMLDGAVIILGQLYYGRLTFNGNIFPIFII